MRAPAKACFDLDVGIAIVMDFTWYLGMKRSVSYGSYNLFAGQRFEYALL